MRLEPRFTVTQAITTDLARIRGQRSCDKL